MKFFLIHFFLISCFNVFYGQEPPAWIKINSKELLGNDVELDELYKKYDFGIMHLNDEYSENKIDNYISDKKVSIHPNTIPEKISKKGHWELVINNYLLVPIPPVTGFVKRGDLFSLHIKNKKTKKAMNLFFRSSMRFGIEEFIEIQNIQFMEGYFFYDMCDSKKKFQPDYLSELENNKNQKNDNEGVRKAIISLRNLKKHKTSLKCINKIVQKYSCEQVKTQNK